MLGSGTIIYTNIHIQKHQTPSSNLSAELEVSLNYFRTRTLSTIVNNQIILY
jgi:hypothetical protein